MKCITEKMNLPLNKLVATCTDGAPSMVGRIVGAVALLERSSGKQIRKYYCISHRHVLCSKIIKFHHLMSIVVAAVNYIWNNGLNHRTFQAFFQEADAKYSDL
jgi:hypothetical protein